MARDTARDTATAAAPVTTWRDAVLADDIGSSSVVGGLRPAELAAPARPRMPPADAAGGAAGAAGQRCSWVMVVAHSLDLIALGLLASVAALLRYQLWGRVLSAREAGKAASLMRHCVRV